MIRHENIKKFTDVEFEKYLAMPGFSNSFLKSEVNGVSAGIVVSEAMRVGSMVDAILTEPHKVDMTSPFYATGREIAIKVKKEFGDLISKFSPQVNFIGDIVYEEQGFEYRMPTKGRLDWYVENEIVIDLKITKSKDPRALIEFMQYKEQLWHYSRISKAKSAFIIIHSRPLKKTNLIQIDVSGESTFWKEKTMKFGTIKEIV